MTRTASPFRPPPAIPIAVIGMGCRLPGGIADPDALWQLLIERRDAVGRVSPDRWDADAFYHDGIGAAGKINTREGAFLADVDGFDATFFGVSKGVARQLDPRHRLLLEVAWETLERAAIVPADLAGTPCGVFVGIAGEDYAARCFEDPETISAYSLTGNLISLAANRISNWFDFHGPSIAIDTACSSSLVSVHLACQSLALDECDLALAGGVNLVLSPHPTIAMAQSWLLARDGRCKSFDAGADGYGRADGCGMVLLKRLDDALADGDIIHAVIRGSAVAHRGRGKALTAPAAEAQVGVIRAALERAGLEPGAIGYVEAHGVGSALTDAAEAKALTEAFGTEGPFIGALKSNLGHSEAAAGISSLLKAILCVRNSAVPANLHFSRLNEEIADESFACRLPTALVPWVRPDGPRAAGVNAFGIGGTNAHIIVCEAPPAAKRRASARGPALILPLSARTRPALAALTLRWAKWLETRSDLALADLAHTAAAARARFKHRLAIIASDRKATVTLLRKAAASNNAEGLWRAPGAEARAVTLAQAWLAGEAIEGPGGKRVEAPTYAFEHARYWVESKSARPAETKFTLSPLAVRLHESPVRRRHGLLCDWLADQVQELLGSEAARPSRNMGFFALGLSSLAAVELHGRVTRVLDLSDKLDATVLFEHTTISALAAHILERLGLESGSEKAAAVPAVDARIDNAEPIAIVGTALQFPGATSAEQFWQRLCDRMDGVDDIGDARWDAAAFAARLEPGEEIQSRYAGLVREVDLFDARFFEISPREARATDPQQRILLQLAWEAMEDAGIAGDMPALARCGVYVGISNADYAVLQYRGSGTKGLDGHFGSGNLLSFSAGRLAYVLGLQGPVLAVDTACSSSLVSVHLAVQSLRRGECDLALAGGVNLILSPEPSLFLSRSGALSKAGRCRTFDADADGYVRGEGCGLVVLKRLSDARAAGDRILAVIRGSAVNHDGRSAGLTVPNGAAQQRVIRAALADAGVSGDAIGYVEAHGTGTVLGDPIEARALGAVLGAGRPSGPGERLIVGSVKTNIGHLEAAAGVAGLIKAALVVNKGAIPAHLHFKAINPHIDLAETPIAIPTTLTPWPEGRPRLAGVSSFGLSGTNAHVILEAPPAEAMDIGDEAVVNGSASAGPCWHVLPLSARDGTALHKRITDFANLLAQGSEPLGAVCSTAARRRSHLPVRAAAIAENVQAMIAELDALRRRLADAPPSTRQDGALRIAFLFSGQGGYWRGMGRALLATEPVFRESYVACSAAVAATGLAVPPLDLIAASQEDPLHGRADAIQPAYWAWQVAMSSLLASWGVQPDMVVGHSMGEIAAAHVAGALSLDDAARIVALRGQLTVPLQGEGAMAAINLPPAEVEPALAPYAGRAFIAAHNATCATIISGELHAIAQLRTAFEAKGVFVRAIDVDFPAHTPLVAEAAVQFEAALDGLVPRRSEIPILSTVTSQAIDSSALNAAYWARNMREPVRFAATMAGPIGESDLLFVEISPHAVLLPALAEERSAARGAPHLVATGRREQELLSTRQTIADLYTAGLDIRWDTIAKPTPPTRLPPYPWQKISYWAEGIEPLGERAVDDCFFETVWTQLPHPAPGPISTGLAVTGNAPLALALAARLGAPLMPMEKLATTLAKGGVDRLIWIPAEPQGMSPTATAERVCGTMLELIQTCIHPGVRLFAATSGAQPVVDGEDVSLWAAPLWGLGRVAGMEHPEIWGGMIDLDPCHETEEAVEDLVRLLRALPRGETQLALRGGTARIARLRPRAIAPTPLPKLDPQASHLVTGGLGGIGLEVAAWLVRRGARYLVLTGRRGLPEGPSPAHAAIERLTAAGASVRVVAADAADKGALAAILADCAAAGHPVRGIMHAAGALDDGTLLNLTPERFAAPLRTKLGGALALHDLTQGMELDIFMLFSSVASLIGSPGQGNYAAANAGLDAVAAMRRARGLPAISVNWGPWAQVGLAATAPLFGHRIMAPMSPRHGIIALERALGSGRAQIGVLRWQPDFLADLGDAAPPQLLDLVGKGKRNDSVGLALLARLESLPPGERRQILILRVQQEVAAALGKAAREPPTASDGFFPLGLDSLLALELRNRLQALTGQRMPVTILFEASNIERLVDCLLDLTPQEETTAPKPVAVVPEPEAVDLDALSDEEAERLLLERLSVLEQQDDYGPG